MYVIEKCSILHVYYRIIALLTSEYYQSYKIRSVCLSKPVLKRTWAGHLHMRYSEHETKMINLEEGKILTTGETNWHSVY